MRGVLGRAIVAGEALDLPREAVLDGEGDDAAATIFGAVLVPFLGPDAWNRMARGREEAAAALPEPRPVDECLEDVRRLVLRHDLSEAEKRLASAAARGGVRNFSNFQNAGYRGFYRHPMAELRELRDPDGRMENRVLFDFCGVQELALHRYRVRALATRLAEAHAAGREETEAYAEETGRELRRLATAMLDRRPEDLPLAADIHEARSFWRKVQRKMGELSIG